MTSIHFQKDEDSIRRLDKIFSTYGWSATIKVDMQAVSCFLELLEKELIEVTEVPYQYEADNILLDRKLLRQYDELALHTLWRSGTGIQNVRMTALKLMKHYGEAETDGTHFVYEDGRVCVYVGNQEVFDLMCFLTMNRVVQQWIIFPDPRKKKKTAYYIFDIDPKAVDIMETYRRAAMDDVVRKLEALFSADHPDFPKDYVDSMAFPK